MGLVAGFFLNGIVFLSSQGRSQWVFLTQKVPTIIRLEAGGSTAGFAQLGIIVFVVEGRGICRVQLLGQDGGQWALSQVRYTYDIQSKMRVDVLGSG